MEYEVLIDENGQPYEDNGQPLVFNLQEKEVTPSDSEQIVTPDDGYVGLNKVTVGKAEGVPESLFAGIIDKTASGAISSDLVTKVGYYGLYNCRNITSIVFPNLTQVDSYCFGSCINLKTLRLPLLVNGLSYFCSSCSSLTDINMDSLESTQTNSFSSCTSLVNVNFPKLRTLASSCFSTCSKLEKIVLPSLTSISTNSFASCINLKVVDLRGVTSIPSLANVNAFYNSNSSKRKIVVPDELYDTWITSTNWNSTTYNIVGSIIKASDYVE